MSNDMRILNLGIDNRALDKDSQLARRIKDYGALEGVDSYVMIVPSDKKDAVSLSEKAKVIPSGGNNKLAQLIGMKWRVYQELRRNKYDLITVQDAYYVGFLAWGLAKFFRVGLEIQVHGFEKFSGLRKMIARFILPRTDSVRVVSNRLKKLLIAEFKVDAAKIIKIPIFNNKEYDQSLIKNDYSVPEGKFVFFTASRLVPVKNISLQFQALAEITKKFPQAELHIAGDGPDLNELKNIAKDLKINVSFLNWLDTVALVEEFRKADCFLLTSDSEGWGLVAVEAAAHCLPIIMTDVGLAGEIIKDNESGLVITVGSKEKLIESMEKIVTDQNLRRKLGQGALESVKKLPDYQQTLEMYLAGWQKAVKKVRKLLILTQKVDINDNYLGFFHDWLKEFFGHYDLITVICLYKGEYDLPENVRVFSLGKETKASRWNYIWNFYCYIWKFRKDYDAVFVHMNPEYVVMGGLFWKLWHKPISLWFVHKSVNWKLRIAEKLSKVIFTSAKESFNLLSSKVIYLGHGINTDKFKPGPDKSRGDKFEIIYVGRISPIKNQELLIKAAAILKRKYQTENFLIRIIGDTIYDYDVAYKNKLEDLIKNEGLGEKVSFVGNVPYREIEQVYQNTDLSLNLCPTGGMDKAVLESMASGTLAIVFNKTFNALLNGYPQLILGSLEPQELADKIEHLHRLDEKEYSAIAAELNNRVEQDFSLQQTIKIMVSKI